MYPSRTSVALVAHSSNSDDSGTYRRGVLGSRACIWMSVARVVLFKICIMLLF